MDKGGIGNRALTKLGCERITSFEDRAETARSLAAVWDGLRDNEQRIYRWNFCRAHAALPALAGVSHFGYATALQLPADFLRLRQIGETDVDLSGGQSAASWVIQGRTLLVNLAPPVDIIYSARCIDVTLWDAAFAEAFACRLAMELAQKLTQSNTVQQRMDGGYRQALRDARRSNALERAAEPMAPSPWLMARQS